MSNIPHHKTIKGHFWAGTSGLVLPVPNKQSYPAEFRDKSRLSYYASLFNSLEVNSSFYKVPMAATVKRWATEVPEDFTFTFKLFRGITHNKALEFEESQVGRFMDIIGQAGEKKGALLVQFPGGTRFDSFTQFERLLKLIRQCDPLKKWDVCVEFRHSSWYMGETYEVLAEYHAAMVRHDMPKSKPQEFISAVGFEYLRFHGPAGDYKGGYTEQELNTAAASIRTWLKEGKTVYTYFNNTIGDALQNLVDITGLVRS